ncbi:MAG TPA: HK97-gp10 family putative phage morphogenesis protein [Vicinamibacterales bacterium]|nr:HK97-gp10 family putative phage morphogenesis protein [Vicinamibacterales bacterium]
MPAIETTVLEIARQAKSIVLASPSVQTRALHDHIAAKVIKTSGRGIVGVTAGSTTLRLGNRRVRVKGIVRAGEGGSALTSAGARIDRPSRRAHFVEFGTRKMPAEPFMIPAAERQQGPFLARCQAAGRTIERNVAAVGSRNL